MAVEEKVGVRTSNAMPLQAVTQGTPAHFQEASCPYHIGLCSHEGLSDARRFIEAVPAVIDRQRIRLSRRIRET
jgi:hypothetical protein